LELFKSRAGLLVIAAVAITGVAVTLYRPRPKASPSPPPPIAEAVRATPTPSPPCTASPSDAMPRAGALWVARKSEILFRFIPPGCYRRGLGMIRMVNGRGQFPFYRRDTITRGFWMAETETTQNEWLRLMGNNPSFRKNHSDCPVESVSWVDAARFANALSLREGLATCYTLRGSEIEFAGLDCPGFRLPTQSEWTYAFRGTEGRRFPWGDEEPTATRGNWGGSHDATMPVRLFPDERTPHGVYGLAANVSEWVNDWEETTAVGTKEDQIDPLGPPAGKLRQWVGTDYLQSKVYVEMAGGGASLPDQSQPNLGVRLVRTWRAPE
jgi:eukaryotic-like serine/threonine-protein kinase